jgi:hypothetical protein
MPYWEISPIVVEFFRLAAIIRRNRAWFTERRQTYIINRLTDTVVMLDWKLQPTDFTFLQLSSVFLQNEPSSRKDVNGLLLCLLNRLTNIFKILNSKLSPTVIAFRRLSAIILLFSV